jgi:hypothetical protein
MFQVMYDIARASGSGKAYEGCLLLCELGMVCKSRQVEEANFGSGSGSGFGMPVKRRRESCRLLRVECCVPSSYPNICFCFAVRCTERCSENIVCGLMRENDL